MFSYVLHNDIYHKESGYWCILQWETEWKYICVWNQKCYPIYNAKYWQNQLPETTNLEKQNYKLKQKLNHYFEIYLEVKNPTHTILQNSYMYQSLSGSKSGIKIKQETGIKSFQKLRY